MAGSDAKIQDFKYRSSTGKVVCIGNPGFSVDRQPNLAEALPLWPAGVAVAEFDVLEVAAL